MKKIIVLFLLFFISSFSVTGLEQVTGYVSINIENKAPEITSIFFDKDEIYEDSTIECDATVIDEHPDDINLKYMWYVNKNALRIHTKFLSSEYFEANDNITCKIIPNDWTQDGEPRNISITVKPIPVGTRITKGVLQLAGVSTNAEEIISIRREKGMMGVTGFVVGELGGQSKGLVISFFILVLMIMLLLTVNLVLRSHAKKHKS